MTSSILNRLRTNPPERTLYFLGILVPALGIIVILLQNTFSLTLPGQGLPCLFYLLTKLYCPGCGGTRALGFFLHGNILTSFYYNSFVAYFLMYYVIFMSSHTLSFLTRGKVKGLSFRLWHVLVGVFLLVFTFLLRNIFHLGQIPIL